MATRQEMIRQLRENHPFFNNQQLVYELVLHEILTLQLKSGDTISQGKLSSDFNLSRGPIKSALEKLAEDGFLTQSISGTFSVAQATNRFSTNILAFKRQLDILTINQATYNMRPKDFTLAQERLNQLEDSLQNQDYGRFCSVDVEFHMVFVNSTDNPLLVNTYQQYRDLFVLQAIINNEFEKNTNRLMLLIHRNI